MTKPPCYNCPSRSTSCHSSCTNYQDWKRELEKEKQNREKDKTITLSEWYHRYH